MKQSRTVALSAERVLELFEQKDDSNDGTSSPRNTKTAMGSKNKKLAKQNVF